MINKINGGNAFICSKKSDSKNEIAFKGSIRFEISNSIVEKMNKQELDVFNTLKTYVTEGEGKKLIEKLPKNTELSVEASEHYVGGTGVFAMLHDNTQSNFKSWWLKDTKKEQIPEDVHNFVDSFKKIVKDQEIKEKEEFKNLKWYKKIGVVISNLLS